MRVCPPKPSCCLSCHFDDEERYLFPNLPPEIRRNLEAEHAGLRELGNHPRDRAAHQMIAAHAAREMQWIRMFCTPEQIDWCESDHEKLGTQGKSANQ